MGWLERIFDLKAQGTNLTTELRAGVVTFLTMAYILLVNPQILARAGMPAEDVAVATALSAAVATLVMGLLARLPFALAPGMGLNAYFAYAVVGGLGVSWQVALGAVFVSGVIFFILALSGIRTVLLRAIPEPIQVATMGGIGLLLAAIGLQNAGFVVSHPTTLVTLGNLRNPEPALALLGLMVIGALLAIGVRGALLFGVAGVAGLAWAFGVAPLPAEWIALPHLPRETLFALDLEGLVSGPLWVAVGAFLFVDLFDTAGTLMGVGRLGGFVRPDGSLPRADQAFAADAVGTTVGAMLGTSTVTTYVESATGVEEGGRTGLTATVVAGLFVLALFLTPTFVAIPLWATAPALIVVGALMMRGCAAVDWTRPEDGLPAFLTLAGMPLTFSIANGVSAGIVSWAAIRLFSGRGGEVPPLMYALTVVIGLYYLFV